MAQLIVRNLENSIKERLRERARKHRRSMEEEAREILRNSVSQEEPVREGLGTRIAKLFRKNGFDNEIPELRGHTLTPAKFDE
jgi:plasmid stability protein